MDGRRYDPRSLYLHLAVVAAVIAGLLVLTRQLVPAATAAAVTLGLFVLARSTPERRDTVGPVLDGPGRPVDGGDATPALDPPPPADTRPAHAHSTDTATADAPGEAVVPHLPPRPSGRRRGPWAPPTRRVRVRSGARHAAALDRVRPQAPDITAVLLSDSTSRSHPYAVVVYVGEEYVGDLVGDDVLDYGPVLAQAADRGIDVCVVATLTTTALEVVLPEPAGLLPINEAPDGIVLPHGAPVVVHLTGDPRGEDGGRHTPRGGDGRAGEVDPGGDGATHAPGVMRYASPGEEVWLAATLHQVRPARRRDPVSIIDVAVDGTVVGQVTGDEAADLIPLVRFCNDRNLLPVATATLRSSSLHTALSLSCIRAQDADEGWLRSLPRR